MNRSILSPARAARAFAAAFLLAGLLGLVPNPLVGSDALFQTNLAHNLVHFATAAGFALVARAGDGAALAFMRAFGVVYLLVGIAGWVTLGGAPEGMLLSVIHINTLDNFLHVGLSIAILGTSAITVPAASGEQAPAG